MARGQRDARRGPRNRALTRRAVLEAIGFLAWITVETAASGLPRAARAAPVPQPGWLTEAAPPLRIAYRPETATAAAALKSGLASTTQALEAAFGADLPLPFTLRLYATDDAFGADHPLARRVDGGWVEEHRPRREAAVVVPFVADGAVDAGALAVAVRYALAHAILANGSAGRLPGGFQEGIARLVIPPSADTQAGVATLRSALDRGALVQWTDLAVPGSAYLKPDITYPQSLSMAVFLVGRHGFGCLADLIGASAGDVPFRSAFEAACGETLDQAEAEWSAWLPGYVDGGWRAHPLFSPDLALARQLFAEGEDARAVALLRAIVAVNAGGPVADDARSLLARAEAGVDADLALATAESALAAGDYATVRAAAERARQRAAEVGATGVLNTAADLDARGEAGLAAASDLVRSTQLGSWRLFAARAAAARAADAYARLGNDLAAARARARLDALSRRAAPFGWLFIVAGLATLGHAVRRRRRLAHPEMRPRARRRGAADGDTRRGAGLAAPARRAARTVGQR